MKALTGAVVVLAGAVLAAGGAVAEAIPQSQGRFAGTGAAMTGAGGGALVLLGLLLLLFGSLPEGRRIAAVERPDAR
jgi:hypothetical protein